MCPLTMEVFRDPVITPAGHSYERKSLLEHLEKVRHTYQSDSELKQSES